ncbi:MAG: hypothetical protein JWM59_3601 [Verrucomicrobiales bacterium]|nr:hypothetical protein [Verrucomicrobiales bacterium]
MKPTDTAESITPFLTAKDLRERWKVSGMFLHRIRAAGRLPVYKIGKRGVRFALTDVVRIESESAA